MKSRFKQVVLMTVVSLPLVASARTVPASSGRPVVWNDGPCFVLGSSSVANTCARKSFEIPLAVDSSGSKTVEVTAFGNTSSNNVCCTAVGLHRNLTLGGASPQVCLSTFGIASTITLTGAFVPSGGSLYVACNVDTGGRIHSIQYNP